MACIYREHYCSVFTVSSLLRNPMLSSVHLLLCCLSHSVCFWLQNESLFAAHPYGLAWDSVREWWLFTTVCSLCCQHITGTTVFRESVFTESHSKTQPLCSFTTQWVFPWNYREWSYVHISTLNSPLLSSTNFDCLSMIRLHFPGAVFTLLNDSDGDIRMDTFIPHSVPFALESHHRQKEDLKVKRFVSCSNHIAIEFVYWFNRICCQTMDFEVLRSIPNWDCSLSPQRYWGIYWCSIWMITSKMCTISRCPEGPQKGPRSRSKWGIPISSTLCLSQKRTTTMGCLQCAIRRVSIWYGGRRRSRRCCVMQQALQWAKIRCLWFRGIRSGFFDIHRILDVIWAKWFILQTRIQPELSRIGILERLGIRLRLRKRGESSYYMFPHEHLAPSCKL